MGNKKTTTRNDGTTTTNYTTVNEMANDVRGVLKSIIHQENKYTTQEAGSVSKLYNGELTRMKLQVEVHKINHKSSNSPANEVLSLT